MTNEQKAWLDSHPEYEAVGVTGGRVTYVERGVLASDGGFTRGKFVAGRDAGAFPVGKRRVRDALRPLELSDPRGPAAAPHQPAGADKVMAVAPPSSNPFAGPLPRKV